MLQVLRVRIENSEEILVFAKVLVKLCQALLECAKGWYSMQSLGGSWRKIQVGGTKISKAFFRELALSRIRSFGDFAWMILEA